MTAPAKGPGVRFSFLNPDPALTYEVSRMVGKIVGPNADGVNGYALLAPNGTIQSDILNEGDDPIPVVSSEGGAVLSVDTDDLYPNTGGSSIGGRYDYKVILRSGEGQQSADFSFVIDGDAAYEVEDGKILYRSIINVAAQANAVQVEEQVMAQAKLEAAQQLEAAEAVLIAAQTAETQALADLATVQADPEAAEEIQAATDAATAATAAVAEAVTAVETAQAAVTALAA